MTRRTDLLDELASLRDFGDTPRIDTTSRRLEATGRLLAIATTELETLHTLAYNRDAARRDAVVAGGSRDYALDTHGNPKARQHYRRLALAALDVCDILAEAAHDVTSFLASDGYRDERRRGGEKLNAVDMALALEAQARRAARGEFAPLRVVPQPMSEEAGKVTLESLAADNRRLRDENARLLSVVQRKDNKHGWRRAPKAQ